MLNLQPGLGGVNLEDISNPKCFYILDTLREKAEIPIWHDDQQGTATVTLAGLMNALKVVGKKKEDVSIAFIGSGASNVACSRLIFGWGADPSRCFMVDSKGILGKHRKDLEMRKAEYVDKWRLCNITNAEGREGGIAEAMQGADVVIALSRSGPGVILPEWVRTMAKDAIVFACANPVPEIWPWEAMEAGAAVVAPGAPISPTRSTTRSASRASSAARWTCAPARSPTRCASPPPRRWLIMSATSSASGTSCPRWTTGKSSPRSGRSRYEGDRTGPGTRRPHLRRAVPDGLKDHRPLPKTDRDDDGAGFHRDAERMKCSFWLLVFGH